MPEASAADSALNKFHDRGRSGFANLTLASGQRIFLSLAKSGLRVHPLIFRDWLPGRRLFAADADTVAAIVRVLARDVDRLPELPEWAAMDSFLAGAIRSIKDPRAAAAAPIAGDATSTPLAVLTRAALAQPDSAALVRRFTRAAATA